MCNINLNTLLTGADIGGTWSQLSGPSTVSVTNGMFNTDGVTIGIYVFEYCISACGDTFCSQVTVNVEQGQDNITLNLCLNGIYDLLTLINTEIGSTYVNGTNFQITYNTGSPTSTSINLSNPFTVNANTLAPNTYVLKVKKVLNNSGNPMWADCPCEFLVTINAQGCTPLTLNLVNNCTLGIVGTCNPNTAVLEKQINGVWTTVQTVTVPSQYVLTPGTSGTYRLRHTAGSCTEYSQEVTINCPCSECDFNITFPTAPLATDGSGCLIGMIYKFVTGIPTPIALPNYPYGPNSTILQQDLQNYEINGNTGGIVTVVTSDNCVSKLRIENTCNVYAYAEGPSGPCGTSFDINCIDFRASFTTTSNCNGNVLPYYTMDIYPELQTGTSCIILINKRRVDNQIAHVTRLRKTGTTNIIVANVNTLPVYNGTHYKYDAHVDNGGAGNGTYYTETIKTIGNPDAIESCVEVILTECNCTNCSPVTLQLNPAPACANVTVTTCPNPGNYILRVEHSPQQDPFAALGWQDFFPGQWSSPYTFNLFAPVAGNYYRARLYKATGSCPPILSNIVYLNCVCNCSIVLSLNSTTCQLSWTSNCTNYNLQLERLVISNWQSVGAATSPFQVIIDGQYRIRASRAGCADIISNVITTNCACSSPILTVTGATVQYSNTCNSIDFYYYQGYPSFPSINITSSVPVTWSFNRLSPVPTNITINSNTATEFIFSPLWVDNTCPFSWNNGCITISDGLWGYEIIATRSCGDFEKIVIESYCS